MKKMLASALAALALVVAPTASAGWSDGGASSPTGWSWNG